MSKSRRETPDEKKLLDAARRCQEETIGILVKSGKVDLNVADEHGSTAVHFSCKAADLSSLGVLLEHGARTGVFDNRDKAPIHYAAEKDYVETLGLLIAYKGDVNLKDKKTGKTALHYACEFNKSRSIKFLLFCGADPAIPDSTDKCPELGSVQAKDPALIQQALNDRKILIFGKMVKIKEKHMFREANLTLENTNKNAKPFSFFCRSMCTDLLSKDIMDRSQLSRCLELSDVEAASDVYEYVVNQKVEDVSLTIPIYSTPDRFDDIYVMDSKGQDYKCQEIKQSKQGSFLVCHVTFEVDEDNFMALVAVKKRRTDKHTVTGNEQTLVSSVEDQFVVHLPASCVPKNSSVELQVLPTEGFHTTLDTDCLTSVSNFCRVQIEHKIRRPVTLLLPCPPEGVHRNEGATVAVYNSQEDGESWKEVSAETVEEGKTVKVTDKLVYNGTYIVAEVSNKRTEDTSTQIKNFLKWLFSKVFTRTKPCCFLALTKPVTENKFRLLVLLTDANASGEALDRWTKDSYITQRSQKTSGYLCRPGNLFNVKLDKVTSSVLGREELELCYQTARESHQEFVIIGRERESVVIYISKCKTGASLDTDGSREVLTQIHVELLKQNPDAQKNVGHQFNDYPDDKFLSWLAGELGYEWMMVGVSLGMRYSYLESVDRGNTHRRTNLTMLYNWREESDKSPDLGVSILVHTLTTVRRKDLVSEISTRVAQLMTTSPTERLCKWVTDRQGKAKKPGAGLDDVDGAPTAPRRDNERFCLSTLIDDAKVVSPYEEKFLLTIVDVIHFNMYVLHQLNLPQDTIEHARHNVSDSRAAMFKCLILARRGYKDQNTFYDDMLGALKHEGNILAIAEIKEACMKWTRTNQGPPNAQTKGLKLTLSKY